MTTFRAGRDMNTTSTSFLDVWSQLTAKSRASSIPSYGASSSSAGGVGAVSTNTSGTSSNSVSSSNSHSNSEIDYQEEGKDQYVDEKFM